MNESERKQVVTTNPKTLIVEEDHTPPPPKRRLLRLFSGPELKHPKTPLRRQPPRQLQLRRQ